jgi:hypothetical protein
MHLAGEAAKSHTFRLRQLGGGEIMTSLRYSETSALVSGDLQSLRGEASAFGERF